MLSLLNIYHKEVRLMISVQRYACKMSSLAVIMKCNDIQKKTGLGYSSVLKPLPSIHEARGSNPSITHMYTDEI